MDSLLNKLGHELVEIRLRALRNVRFKLENGLGDTADVVQNREAVAHLFRWLGAPSAPSAPEASGASGAHLNLNETTETTQREILELILLLVRVSQCDRDGE